MGLLPPLKKDMVVYLLGKLIPALVNLALIVLAMRWLGKETYGEYSLVYYFMMLVSTFTFGWLQQSILRYLSVYKRFSDLAILRYLVLAILSSLVGLLLVFIICPLYFKLSFVDTLLVGASFFLYNMLLYRLTINQAMFRPLVYVLNEGLYNVMMLLSFVVLVKYLGITTYISLFIAMLPGLLLVCLVPLFRQRLVSLRSMVSRAVLHPVFVKKMWTYGILLSVWLSVSYLFNIANRFIIKEFTSYEEVGVFSSVFDIIFKISGFACMPILLAYHPKITALWNQGRKETAMQQVKEALLLEFFIFLLVVVVFMMFRPYLFVNLLHLEEKGLGWMAVVLIVSAFLWQAALLAHKALELLLKLKQMILSILIALIINILGSIILIPLYGFKTAAWSSLLGIVVYLGIVSMLSRHYMKKERRHGA